MKKTDYYEFLQISRRADQETIHRVYRFLAARFHPDNPVSGSAEKFSRLTTAYEVLSDPARRAEYDASYEKESPQKAPLSRTIDFMDTVVGETNRRLAVLAVLYYRRRMNAIFPEVSLTEIEARMGFPRDYLDFTLWYLLKKGYITRADNSDCSLTADGVDYVELQRVNIPILNKMLTGGGDILSSELDGAARNGKPASGPDALSLEPASAAPPVTERRANATDRRAETVERRKHPADRRVGLPDTRENPVERRINKKDRRPKV
ncbi:MAG: DnaJ domain-containing protein [Silvibacterium sp.]